MPITRSTYIWPAFHSRPTVSSRRGVVASGHYAATSAGIRMLAQGGNAVDAGVAAAFALAVVRAHKDGIGGECPILIHSPKTGKVHAISGVGSAPAELSIEYLRSNNIAAIPGFGYLGALVPAQIGAFCTALKLFGTMPLEKILEPAIELCNEGFPMYEGLREFLSTTENGLFTKTLPENGRIFLKDGKAPPCGTPVIQKDLGRTYERLAEAAQGGSDREEGIQRAIDRFYRGDIAREIVEYVRSFPIEDSTGIHTSLLTLEDFFGYETRVEEPYAVPYGEYTVYKCGPWSQGPVLLQNLRLLSGFPLKEMGHNSASYIHTLIECSKIAYNDRNRYYGDTRFVDVPFDTLLSAEYAERRRREISPLQANNSIMWEDGLFDARGERDKTDTTHLDVIDGDGFMMSATPSGGWIRSSARVPGVGLQLTTRGQMFYMDDASPNSLQPGKRPRTTLTPTLAMKNGRPFMAFGSPGGDNQDQWSLQTFLNVAEFDMYLQDAVDAATVYTCHFRDSFYPHEAMPGYVFYEPLPPAVVNELIRRGHKMAALEPYSSGEVCVVRLNDKTGFIEGAASPKEERQAYAMGW